MVKLGQIEILEAVLLGCCKKELNDSGRAFIRSLIKHTNQQVRNLKRAAEQKNKGCGCKKSKT